LPGGDGTINEVVNGLAADFTQATLGIIPLGTGNDLARTLAPLDDPQEALALLTQGPVRPIDLIKIESADAMVYGVKVAAGGFSGPVDEALSDERRDQRSDHLAPGGPCPPAWGRCRCLRRSAIARANA
jgi:diacylglycerol kinase (ATP)